MARLESAAKLGYYAFPSDLLSYVSRMFVPTTTNVRAIDVCAGEGEAIAEITSALNLKPYAVELEGNRYESCLNSFGFEQALHADIFDADISNEAFALVWNNPPYGDKTGRDSKMRQELEFVDLAHKWVAPAGYHVIVVYTQHITRPFIQNVARHSDMVDMYHAWDERLGYNYVVVVARKRTGKSEAAEIAAQMEAAMEAGLPRLQDSPVGKYQLPTPEKGQNFRFTTYQVNMEQMIQLINNHGADTTNRFIVKNTPAPMLKPVAPVVPPKEGHLMTMVLGGAFNYVPVVTESGNRAILRSRTRSERKEVSVEYDEKGNKKVTNLITPMTTLTLLHENTGTIETFKSGEEFTKFLSLYYGQLTDHADKLFPAKYNISTPYAQEPNKRRWFPYIMPQRVKGKFPLMTAQVHVAAAMATAMWEENNPYRGLLLLAATGTGKTNMGLALFDASQREGKIGAGQVVLITCPSHLVEKWEREALDQLKDRRVWVIHKSDSVKPEKGDVLYQLGKAMREAQAISKKNLETLGYDHTVKLVIISQDTAKRGEGWAVAANRREVWFNAETNKRIHTNMNGGELSERKAALLTAKGYKLIDGGVYFTCPVTGSPLLMEVETESGLKIEVPMTEKELGKKRHNYKVSEVWGYSTDDNGKRFTVRKHNRYHVAWDERRQYGLRRAKQGTSPDMWLNSLGVRMPLNATAPIWRLLKSQFSDKVAIYFADEAHESSGGKQRTDRQDSFEHLSDIAKMNVFATATALNGYSSSMYSICTRVNPRLYERYPNTAAGRQTWVRDMGVLQEVKEEKASKSSGKNTGVNRTDSNVSEAPGISPLLINEILPYSIVLELLDVADTSEEDNGKRKMVEKLEAPIELDMPEDMKKTYDNAAKILEAYHEGQRMVGDGSFGLVMYNALLRWVDTPYEEMEVWHKVLVKDEYNRVIDSYMHLVHTIPGLGDFVTPKEQEIVYLVWEQIKRGRGVGIFVRDVGVRDIRHRLKALIEKEVDGANVFILDANDTEPFEREAILNEQFAMGVNVLITNGNLVKTGLDLLNLQRLISYTPEPQLDTLEQMMGRAWRLPQTVPCENYYMTYKDCMQYKLSELVHEKRVALKAVQGEIMGLFSFKAVGSLISELMKGGKSEKSLAESFREINKRDVIKTAWQYEDVVDAEGFTVPQLVPAPTPAPKEEAGRVLYPKFLEAKEESPKPVFKKTASGQLSFF